MDDAGDDGNEASIEDIRNNNLPRRKWFTLWLHASIMCGREFLYAVEIVFVTPIILQLGMPEKYYSFMWCFSPIVSILIGPILGSRSDRCKSRFGRRRPYIVGLVIGALIGLTFLIFSKDLATSLGGSDHDDRRLWGVVIGIIGAQFLDFCLDQTETPLRAYTLDVCSLKDQQRAFALQTVFIGIGGALGFIVDGIDWESTVLSAVLGSQVKIVYMFAVFAYVTTTICNLISVKEVPLSSKRAAARSNATLTTRVVTSQIPQFNESSSLQAASCADESTQTVAEDNNYSLPPVTRNQNGRTTPSILVSICEDGDMFQAAEGQESTNPLNDSSDKCMTPRSGIPLASNSPGTKKQSASVQESRSHDSEDSTKRPVASKVEQRSGIFDFLCPKNIPSKHKNKIEQLPVPSSHLSHCENEVQKKLLDTADADIPQNGDSCSHPMNATRVDGNLVDDVSPKKYLKKNGIHANGTDEKILSEKLLKGKKISKKEDSSLKVLWLSIITMPSQLKWLCLAQLLGFIGFETVMLWYTDLMGRVIYGGDPQAPTNSTQFALYNAGVKMGCWGLAVYSVAMVLFSVFLERMRILKRFSIRLLYSFSFLLMAATMLLMFVFANKYVILSLSWAIGVSTAVLLIVPYVLVGKYHLNLKYVRKSPGNNRRGFGLDCGILACQMYAGNVISAAISSPVIHFAGTCKAMLILTGVCNFAAFLVAYLFVTYPGEGRSRCQATDMVERSTETIDVM